MTAKLGEILHEFGLTYRVMTKEERLEDLDKAETAILAWFEEILPPEKEIKFVEDNCLQNLVMQQNIGRNSYRQALLNRIRGKG